MELTVLNQPVRSYEPKTLMQWVHCSKRPASPADWRFMREHAWGLRCPNADVVDYVLRSYGGVAVLMQQCLVCAARRQLDPSIQ